MFCHDQPKLTVCADGVPTNLPSSDPVHDEMVVE